MKLSRLEIYGFKSFAKKLDLKLTGGITAVVGPNGCGKTNVVDAIRWVLGEQRPTQIRLERMEDVLFKGSSTRRQLGMSEVSLTIENISGILPVHMPEVTITRRLFRSGESDYMINRKSCRLADINDLFMDTGMGTDSYSVFELAMINAILSDKTDDRRHIFEEAAGVTKYKARRKSALNKLISIQDDLERVGDIITELDRRVDSLRRQAAKARRYRKLKSEIKARTISLASFELARHGKKAAETAQELERVQTSLEALRVSVSRMTAEVETLSASAVDVEKELEETARRYSESMNTINEREKDLARLDARLESLDEIVTRARETSKRNAMSLDTLARTHGDTAGALTEVSERLEEVERSYSEARERYESLRKEVLGRSERLAETERQHRTAEQELTAKKATLANIAARREGNERRLSEISLRTGEIGKTLAGIESEIERMRERKKTGITSIDTVSDKLSDEKESLDGCVEELAVIDGRLREALEKQALLKAEHEFLAEILRSYEGYSDGVKHAVTSDRLSGRVHGVLGDHISTEERYMPAVEAALRESIQTVIVGTTDDALDGVRYLSEGKRGRAAFLPLDAADKQQVIQQMPKAPGVVAGLCDVIRTDEKFRPVVARMFGDVVIVDTLKTAVELHRQYRNSGALRFVTLSGEMIGLSGDIHGGRTQNKKDTALGRAEKLKALTASLEKVTGEVGSLQEQRRERSEHAMVLRGMIAETEKALDAAKKEYAELLSQEAQAAARRDAIMESRENLQAEASKIQSSFSDYETEALSIGEHIEALKKKRDDLGGQLSEAGTELNDLRNELEARRGAVSELEVERAALTEKKAALTRELDSIGERREALANSSNRTLREIDAAETEILDVGDAKKNILGELEKLESGHEELKRAKDEIEKRYADLRAQRSDKEREIHNIRRELDDVARKESSLIIRRDETVMMMNNIRERLADDYYVSPEEIPAEPDDKEFDPENEKLVLDDLRRKMHTIGDVNLAAEKDYEEEKKRLDFLVTERNDLIESSDTLKETITKINAIARSRFTDTFEAIRSNFQNVFLEFFEGGVCDLELQEHEDPLEADILITARPPGKNVRSINLLSSGERALTAISLLFAIYLVKPSPFCILDEVDAPLDDANIDRYLNVIRRFSERTQFIMVTHNKKTMAAADNLYGITMEEPGLSTLVSVRLSDIQQDGKIASREEKTVTA